MDQTTVRGRHGSRGEAGEYYIYEVFALLLGKRGYGSSGLGFAIAVGLFFLPGGALGEGLVGLTGLFFSG